MIMAKIIPYGVLKGVNSIRGTWACVVSFDGSRPTIPVAFSGLTANIVTVIKTNGCSNDTKDNDDSPNNCILKKRKLSMHPLSFPLIQLPCTYNKEQRPPPKDSTENSNYSNNDDEDIDYKRNGCTTHYIIASNELIRLIGFNKLPNSNGKSYNTKDLGRGESERQLEREMSTK